MSDRIIAKGIESQHLRRKDILVAIETLSAPSYRCDLGGGLVLRWSTAADAERLSEMYVEAFRHEKNTPPSPNLPTWVRDMLGGHHPLIAPGDFALVEDTDRGRVVSATCLLDQVWEYEGIAMTVGPPVLVATDWDYRERGLVRAIFELIHARSAARGHLALGITGIPYYYRQFGYEYALDQDGHRFVSFVAIPHLKDGEPEPYTLRDAGLDDLPRVMALYDCERARGPVSTRIDEAYWRWVLAGQNPEGAEGWRTQLILDGEGRSVGYVLRPAALGRVGACAGPVGRAGRAARARAAVGNAGAPRAGQDHADVPAAGHPAS